MTNTARSARAIRRPRSVARHPALVVAIAAITWGAADRAAWADVAPAGGAPAGGAPAGGTPADPLLQRAERFDLAPLRVGVLAGFNITDLGGSTEMDVLGTMLSPSLVGGEGGSVGGFLALRLRPQLALRVELMLEQRGASASGGIPVGDGQSAPYSFDYSFLYVAVPVLAEWHIAYDGAISPYLFGGVSLAVNLDADISGQALIADMDGNPVVVEDAEDIGDASRLDVGAMAGIGVRYPMRRGALRFDVRFAHSVTKVLDGYEMRPEQGITLTARTLRTRSMSVVMSYEL